MTFREVLAQVITWLEHDKRLSYRTLQRQFDLDAAYLDALKLELIEVKRLAVDQDGSMLVWTGDKASAAPLASPEEVRRTHELGEVETMSNLTQALELVHRLPATPKRSQQELTLPLALGASLIATKSYAAPEVEQVYARARHLCQPMDAPQQRFPALHNHTEAHACFQHAFDVVRAQQVRALELRTATSLARLWQPQGQRPEAYRLLAEVYGWFTEGFDTVDLQKVKALLEVLA